ncbi:MAG: hypothetical protein HY698_11080 [Deltaproteobacteria bacterium]|nr:hypothetical protein [Deltaproteobacteria bacterium]
MTRASHRPGLLALVFALLGGSVALAQNRKEESAPAPSPAASKDESKSNAGAKKTVTEPVAGFGSETVEVPVPSCHPVRKEIGNGENEFPVPRPPFSKEVFPCTRCHDRPDDFNTTRRTLTVEHRDIKLEHGPRPQWCYGCHNPTDRDKLRLADGRLVAFDESYELCRQCHGPKFRDWRIGLHGRRTGCWNGQKEYRLCVHCHNPHSPHFKPLKPKPRPLRPREGH